MLLIAGCGSTSSVSGFAVDEVEVGGQELTVLVAGTPAQRHQGLMGQEQVPGGADGMLFVYDEPALVSYYMLDTLIPLDIWFFDPNGILIGTAEMEPCPAEPCTDYPSPGEVTRVLETPLGDYEFAPGAVVAAP